MWLSISFDIEVIDRCYVLSSEHSVWHIIGAHDTICSKSIWIIIMMAAWFSIRLLSYFFLKFFSYCWNASNFLLLPIVHSAIINSLGIGMFCVLDSICLINTSKMWLFLSKFSDHILYYFIPIIMYSDGQSSDVWVYKWTMNEWMNQDRQSGS